MGVLWLRMRFSLARVMRGNWPPGVARPYRWSGATRVWTRTGPCFLLPRYVPVCGKARAPEWEYRQYSQGILHTHLQ